MQLPQASDLAKYFSLTQTQKLLRYGNYYTQLKPFLKVFKEDEIIFFNGNRLGKILKTTASTWVVLAHIIRTILHGSYNWSISYGPYHMVHIIWFISDGPYEMDHIKEV